MPSIVTTIHNPAGLATTCRRLGLPAPQQGCVQLDDQEASGWIIPLPGVRFPIVCDTLTGLVAYHPADNVFVRYARVMQFVHRCYDVQAMLRVRGRDSDSPSRVVQQARRFVSARHAC